MNNFSVRGLHLTIALQSITPINMVKLLIGDIFPSLVYNNFEVAQKKLYPQIDRLKFILKETGYSNIQATKPDTTGSPLMDSPIGLAAYILEKFSIWTNHENIHKQNGCLTEKFTLNELLTNVMIYWISPNLGSSLRYYKESMTFLLNLKMHNIPVSASVPSAVCDFPHEIIRSSENQMKIGFKNLVQYTDMPRGGHFAAMEEPTLVSNDIRSFTEKMLAFEENNKNQYK